MKQNHELFGIEVLRFVCAFGVLVWHYQHFFFVGEWNPALGQALRPLLPCYRPLIFFYINGSLAVPFFWAISGFVFYWHYSEDIRGRSVLLPEFAVRRFSRLYPLHFVTLIIVAGGQYVYHLSHGTAFIYIWNKPIWFASQLFLASNWFDRQPESFNGPIWSVSIEILTYLFFFFVARGLRPTALSCACIAGAFAACFDFLHGFLNQQVFACGMFFFVGGVAQRLAAHRHALTVSILALAATLAMLYHGGKGIDMVTLLVLAPASVIVFAKLGESPLGTPFRHLAFLGNATYSSYLLHFPIQLMLVIVVDGIGWKRDLFLRPTVFLAFMLLVISASLLVHRYFEMPAQAAIRRGVKPYMAKSTIPGHLPG